MISCSSLTEAYMEMLKSTLEGDPFMQLTKVRDPISNGEININENIHAAFEAFEFPKEKSGKGRSGAWWIKDRVEALFNPDGEYQSKMNRDGQLEYVISTLKRMRSKTVATWNANRILISLFDPKKDLHISRAPTPPCLISISFYPVRQDLSMMATFRAQYTDTKGYGNLLSLAMLFKEVSEKTGYKPRTLYSVAQKAIRRWPKKTGKALLSSMRSAHR